MKRFSSCAFRSDRNLHVPLLGPAASDQSADEAAIRKAAASYAEAFNKHDAKALADLWSPDAVYLNRTTGEEVVGRDAIAEQFTTPVQGAAAS